MRYKNESKEKKHGVVYTPVDMADYLSSELILNHGCSFDDEITILDPAVGQGELLISIGNSLKKLCI